MSQLVKTKCQANFKDFKRFGAFKGLVEQKTYSTRGPLKRSFQSHFKRAHSYQKRPNLHTNSLNKLIINLQCAPHWVTLKIFTS
jgi:hypothetical protein